MIKKLLLTTILFSVFIAPGMSQYVPNGGFESWGNRVLYQEPVYWNTSNIESFISAAITAHDTIDSYSGTRALRLATMVADMDTLAGYAFCMGTINSGSAADTFIYDGGFPVTTSPDSLGGYFKFHIPVNDTALVLASFKRDGIIVGQNIYRITGDQSDYILMKWDIADMAQTPDTAMIAIACTNPGQPQPGGWMHIDELHFIGTTDTIPNAGFEAWESTGYMEPDNWFSANLFSFMFGSDTSVTASTDAHSGDYAMRIEGIETVIPDEDGFSPAIAGFAMPFSGSYIFGNTMPSIAVDFNPTLLEGYYKFTPAIDDTAFITMLLMDADENTYPSGMVLLPTDEYQYFFVPAIYPSGVEITQVSIIASTSVSSFMTGNNLGGEIGSVLLLDDIDLVNPCDNGSFEIESATPAFCDDYTSLIDAGEGWTEYEWSTGDTTQSITVTISENTTYSVTVTNASGCTYTDEVTIVMPNDCMDIPATDLKLIKVGIYPNPVSDNFTIELTNGVPGEYVTEIIDITGRSINKDSWTVNSTHNKKVFNVSSLPEGLYLIKISGQQFNYCERILIQ